MSDNLNGLLPEKLDLEKPLSELSVLSENEEIYKGLIRWSIRKSDINSETYVKSSYFCIGTPNYCSFYFVFYPNGKNEKLKGNVSIIIQFYTKPPESAWIKGALSIGGQKSKEFHSCATSDISIDKLIETKELRKLICNFESDPIIECKLEMKLREVKCTFDGYTVQRAESREFNHKESLLEDKRFNEFHDVTFCLQGGEVKAHKVLLAQLPYFQKLFDKNGSKMIELTDMKLDIFEYVLKFLYTHDIPVLNFRLASELYVRANEFKIFDLKNICSCYLGANLKEENVFIVFKLAYKYEDVMLKKTCIQFIRSADIDKLVNKSIIV